MSNFLHKNKSLKNIEKIVHSNPFKLRSKLVKPSPSAYLMVKTLDTS